MGSFSIWHWIIVIVVVMLLFGRGKISELMGDVAQGIKAFKKGMSEDDKPSRRAKPDAEDHRPPAGADADAAQRRAETERARPSVDSACAARGAGAERAAWRAACALELRVHVRYLLGRAGRHRRGRADRDRAEGAARRAAHGRAVDGQDPPHGAEFQGQFQEAMREAEMADLKKQFDEMTDTANRPHRLRSARRQSRRRSSSASTRRSADARRHGRIAAAAAPPRSPRRRAAARAAASAGAAPDAAAARLPPPPDAAIAPSAAAAARPNVGERRMNTEDDEKEIEATKAPLMEHLIELRSRLIKALIAFFARLHRLLLLRQHDLQRADLAVRLGRGPENPKFIYTALLEYFWTQIKLAMFGAAFISFPVIAVADLQVRRARPLSPRAQGLPAVSGRDADLLRARRARRLFHRACR